MFWQGKKKTSFLLLRIWGFNLVRVIKCILCIQIVLYFIKKKSFAWGILFNLLMFLVMININYPNGVLKLFLCLGRLLKASIGGTLPSVPCSPGLSFPVLPVLQVTSHNRKVITVTLMWNHSLCENIYWWSLELGYRIEKNENAPLLYI